MEIQNEIVQLELPATGNFKESINFPLVNVGNNTFLLQTLDNTKDLYVHLTRWISCITYMTEKQYKEIVDICKGIRPPLFSEGISSIDNELLSSNIHGISESQSEIDFLGADIRNFDIPSNNYPQNIQQNQIQQRVTKFLFTGCRGGVVKQWNAENDQLIKDWGKVVDGPI